jgi:hypothetical protein
MEALEVLTTEMETKIVLDIPNRELSNNVHKRGLEMLTIINFLMDFIYCFLLIPVKQCNPQTSKE